MFLVKAQDEVIVNVETRIAAWTFLPEENGESIQILHYENGQKNEPHYDYFMGMVNQENGGHRVATVLMYLSDVEKGGETVFPWSEAAESQPKGDDWSDCAKYGYADSICHREFQCDIIGVHQHIHVGSSISHFQSVRHIMYLDNKMEVGSKI
ncbi:probable prolyl 4-hydroxylase 7 isoform X1 [Nicotiana tomentosiformis]|uniref:probable prolyl 4-hydroxylase 7 isoform X1 n=2 Tax=Nicotiana tomentosiformis TaxID=4098 RepID=UPI00388C5261